MIRDIGNRIVRHDDARVVSRRRARSFQTAVVVRPRRLGPSRWPALAPNCCLTCRRTFDGNPRRDGITPRHDPHYCAAQRERWGR